MKIVSGPCGFVALLLGVSLVAGCGGGKAKDQLGATVTGQVTFDGSPVDGATVTFQPADASKKGAFGRTDTEGNFTLSTSTATEGVEPGEYHVTVTKFEIVPSTGPQEGDPGYTGNPRPTPPPKSLLPEKYGNAKSSGLR